MDSSDFRILLDLESALSPRRFYVIRSLEISFLHARLDHRIQMDQVSGNMLTADQEKRLFAPLMDLNWIQAFRVEVTWPPT